MSVLRACDTRYRPKVVVELNAKSSSENSGLWLELIDKNFFQVQPQRRRSENICLTSWRHSEGVAVVEVAEAVVGVVPHEALENWHEAAFGLDLVTEDLTASE